MMGLNLVNKLGLEHKEVLNVHNPTLFPLSKDNPIEQVSVGENFTLALFQDGKVWAWGGTLHKKSAKDLHPR